MYRKIAVEEGLSNVSAALQAAGFHTTVLEGEPLNNVQAVVVKGDGSAILAPEAQLKIPIIHAAGRSAGEVVDVVRDRLS